MLFTSEVLTGIAEGRVTLAFRRWDRPRIAAGARMRTAVGVLEVDAVEAVDPAEVGDADALAAGAPSAAALLAGLRRHGGTLYRIRLHYAGPDPRTALRSDTGLDGAALDDVLARLARLDRAAGPEGPWTAALLRAIAERPALRAADLAAALGCERDRLKRRVRRLKDLGLTESLGTGYRISPRGTALLQRIDTTPR
ncbi:hypothetical protein CLV63_10650 [Murinocardiopsis flavida]|uniref:ASCH domain-containing protein n=1 Tax=Murinocardiopsis flavida TaxID=645275 RepID=A0A2P8DL98_9ACTN|nr:hypothetical protein [Murinocardiopsis flavida]PSK98002.1 hypothetical protein CLV63_10650 [Murinocardiopsis flavida]